MRNTTITRGLAAAAAGILLCIAGCSQQDGEQKVYGRIGFSPITKADLERSRQYLGRISPASRREYAGDAGLEKLIDRHVEDMVMLKDARRHGLDRLPSVTQELDTYRRYLVLRKYDNEILDARCGIPESAFRSYYNDHKDEYRMKARVLAKHILCASKEDAEDVLAKIKAGTAFDDLAAEFSTDAQTKKSKGRLGWITEGGSIPFLGKKPELAEALFALDDGAVGGPVKTDRGWHVIKAEEKKPASYRPLDEVRPQVRDAIFTSGDAVQEYYENHKDEFTVPENRTVSHILVKDEETAKKVRALLDRGRNFETLVKRYSVCPSTKDKDGAVGSVKKDTPIAVAGGKSPVFEQAVFGIEAPGAYAGPVKTDKGWHIIRLDGITPAKTKTQEEAEGAVRAKLLAARKEEGRTAALAALEDKFDVERADDPAAVPPAYVNGRPVTEAALTATGEFQAKVDPSSRGKYDGAAGRKALVDKHVENAVKYLDGMRMSFGNDPKIVDELEQYERYLLLKEYNRQVLEARAGMPEKAFKKYYRNHRDEFKVKGRAQVKHILCATEDDARKVLAELAGGKTFDDAVKEYTTHTQTKSARGRLGWITEDGSIPYLGKLPALNDAVFSAPVGEPAGPVKTDKGYHVILVEKRTPGSIKPLDAVRDKIREALLTDEAYLKKYYEEHKGDYYDKEQRTISHIQLDSEKQAERVLAKLKKGADFGKLAEKYSTNSASAKKGGEIGTIRRGSYIRYIGSNEKAFEDAAFALAKPGDYSGVVESQKKGFHIIRLDGITPAKQKSFEDVRLTIKSRVLNDRKKKGIEAYKKRLMDKARVKIFEIQRSEKELFDLAQKALEDRQYENAVKYYKRIYQDYPKGDKAYQAYFLVGWVYSEYLKDYDEADTYFKIVLDKFPESDLADDAEWMIKNQRNPNALEEIIKKAEQNEKNNQQETAK